MGKNTGSRNARVGGGATVPLTRRAMLGALGVGATVGLAGCSDIEESFDAPIVGLRGVEEIAEVTFKNYTQVPISETVGFPVGGDAGVTLNSHIIRYEGENDGGRYEIGILSVPFFKLGGVEYAGQLDESLDTLVADEYGTDLFNQLLADQPVDSVEYGSIDRDEMIFPSVSTPDIFLDQYTSKLFSVNVVLGGGSEDEYVMMLRRYRTAADALSDGEDESYVFVAFGTTMDEMPALSNTYQHLRALDIIDEPAAE